MTNNTNGDKLLEVVIDLRKKTLPIESLKTYLLEGTEMEDADMNTIIKLVIVSLLSFCAIPVMAAEGGSPQAQVGIGDPNMKPMPETAPASSVTTSTATKRGVIVKNFTKKTLMMTAHRPGMKDLELGPLVPGKEVFLPNAKGTIVSITFKGPWFFKKDLQESFTEGSVAEIHRMDVTD